MRGRSRHEWASDPPSSLFACFQDRWNYGGGTRVHTKNPWYASIPLWRMSPPVTFLCKYLPLASDIHPRARATTLSSRLHYYQAGWRKRSACSPSSCPWLTSTTRARRLRRLPRLRVEEVVSTALGKVLPSCAWISAVGETRRSWWLFGRSKCLCTQHFLSLFRSICVR